MSFEICMDGKKVDETTVWTMAERIARGISTRFGNQGERFDIRLGGENVASFVNGCRLDVEDSKTIKIGE